MMQRNTDSYFSASDDDEKQMWYNRTLIQLWRRGHFYKSNKDDAKFYEIAFANLSSINDILRYFGLQAVADTDNENIYLDVLCYDKDIPCILNTPKPYNYGTSILMILLASHAYNEAEVPFPINEEELFEEFSNHYNDKGDKPKTKDKFNSAVDRCKSMDFMEYDEANRQWLILPYIKCKISRDALNQYLSELEDGNHE